MSGVVPLVIYYRFSILLEPKPVKQKPKKMNTECFQVLNEEVDQLLKVGFIWETLYPDWLANPILVKKKSEKWSLHQFY